MRICLYACMFFDVHVACCVCLDEDMYACIQCNVGTDAGVHVFMYVCMDLCWHACLHACVYVCI